MGETICDDCGLILSVNIFEETEVPNLDKRVWNNNGLTYLSRNKDTGLGSIIQKGDVKTPNDFYKFKNQIRHASFYKTTTERNMMHTAGMFLSYYNGNKFLSEILVKYRNMKEAHLLRGLHSEHIAAGIVYYVLKDRGVPISLKKFSKKINVRIKDIMRTTKRVTKRFGKPHIFSDVNSNEIINVILDNVTLYNKDNKVNFYWFVEYVEQFYKKADENISYTDIISAIYVAARITEENRITQSFLSKHYPLSTVTIRNKVKKICLMIDLEYENLKLYEIENIINGVR